MIGTALKEFLGTVVLTFIVYAILGEQLEQIIGPSALGEILRDPDKRVMVVWLGTYVFFILFFVVSLVYQKLDSAACLEKDERIPKLIKIRRNFFLMMIIVEVVVLLNLQVETSWETQCAFFANLWFITTNLAKIYCYIIKGDSFKIRYALLFASLTCFYAATYFAPPLSFFSQLTLLKLESVSFYIMVGIPMFWAADMSELMVLMGGDHRVYLGSTVPVLASTKEEESKIVLHGGVLPAKAGVKK